MKVQIITLILTLLLGSVSCSAKNDERNLEKVCGADVYQQRIALTKTKIVKAYQPNFPTSPYPNDVFQGCVGISFSIDSNGYAKDIIIKKTSHSRIFNRAAKKAIEKYRFQENDAVIVDAYLIINFDLK